MPNGYSLRVTIVDERDASFYDAGWENALLTLQNVQCDIVVPLPQQTISVIFQNTVEHCIYMSTPINKRERVAFIGAINGLTPNNLTGQTLAAVESLGVLEGIQGNTVAEILRGILGFAELLGQGSIWRYLSLRLFLPGSDYGAGRGGYSDGGWVLHCGCCGWVGERAEQSQYPDDKSLNIWLYNPEQQNIQSTDLSAARCGRGDEPEPYCWRRIGALGHNDN